ncbi:MAG TPA: hypothetical protein VL173_09775 [Vicinamibacterales bacterium]|nr:hypothetical protein [Vicinamibacterales bacterium]
MKLQWISAAILTAALAVGCGDRGQQNSENPDQNQAAPATQGSDVDRQPVSPDADNSAVKPDTSGSRATAGNRAAPARPSTAAPRAEAERNAEPSRPPVPVLHEVTVPAGTTLALELLTPLSSETAQIETPVRARVKSPIEIDGHTAIPAGTVLNGDVTDVVRPGRVEGRARLAFRFTEATINGARETLRTNPVVVEGEATKKSDAEKIGAGAGIGAAIGAIVGGGKGAAKGAAIGGAAGTGTVLATRGKDVELAEGADVTATTAVPVSISAR